MCWPAGGGALALWWPPGAGALPEDLTSFLNGDMLVALWPDLILPWAVRQAWEEQYPVLLAASAAVT